MNLAIRIAAAILSVPPDVLAPMVPMMAPPPRNQLEQQLREEIDSALSGSCCTANTFDSTPLFAMSESETNFVDCQSGLPSTDGDLFTRDEYDEGVPSTYGEITLLGARQLFHHMGLYNKNNLESNPTHQFFDLGSGGGRLVIQSHLELPSVSRSVGIELSPTRHKIAMARLNQLKDSGDMDRIKQIIAQTLWQGKGSDNSASVVDLFEGDLFQLDISKATHIYLSSLCFSEDMLERIVDKMESEGLSLQIVASLRLLPLRTNEVRSKVSVAKLGANPWQEFIEMTWNRGGDGCPVYFYSVKQEL